MLLQRSKYLPEYIVGLDHQIGIKVIQAALSNPWLVDDNGVWGEVIGR